MWWIVWELCVNLVECLCLYHILYRQLKTVPSQKWRTWMGLSLIFLTESILNFLSPPSVSMFAFTLVALPLYALICWQGKRSDRLLWGVVAALVPIAASLTLSAILQLVPNLSPLDTLLDSPARVGTQVVYLSLVVFLSFFLSRRPAGKRPQDDRTFWFVFAGIVCLGTIASVQTIRFAVGTGYEDSERITVVMIASAVLAMQGATIVLFDRMADVTANRVAVERSAQRLKDEHERMQKTEEIRRAWNHDFRNALSVIRFHAARSDTQKILDYLGNIEQEYDDLPQKQRTGVPDIDAIFSIKGRSARVQGIEFSLCGCSLDGLDDLSGELSLVLGNLLDNAIESCAKIAPGMDRYIDVVMKHVHDMTSITITNSSDGNYRMDEDGNLISTKQEDGHGNGFLRLRHLSPQGVIYSIRPEDTYFEITLLLPSKGDAQ